MRPILIAFAFALLCGLSPAARADSQGPPPGPQGPPPGPQDSQSQQGNFQLPSFKQTPFQQPPGFGYAPAGRPPPAPPRPEDPPAQSEPSPPPQPDQPAAGDDAPTNAKGRWGSAAPSPGSGKPRTAAFSDTFAAVVEDYVDARSSFGHFTVKPLNYASFLQLEYDALEPRNIQKNGEEAVGCVDFTLADGTKVDLDFNVTNDGYNWAVSRVFLHKLGDQTLLGPPGGRVRYIPQIGEAAPLTAVDIPPKTATPVNPDAYAVVIGIEKYRDVPKVDYAARDAQSIYDYLTKSMGYDPKNVALLQDDRAGLSDLETYLGPWLADRVGRKSKVMIYYAGHGAPNPTTGEGYLIPYDGNPSYVETKAYPVKKLYESLAKLPSKDVTVVLDACFSGVGGRSVLAKGTRPLVTMKDASTALGSNTVALTASHSDQISTFDEDGRHGLLTYYLLKGLHGEADADKDGDVTTAELFAYLGPAVERGARLQHVEQSPTLSPDPKDLGARGREVWIKTK